MHCLIVLTSLVAEGCPQLALQLARHWQQQGIQVELLCLQPQPTDLLPEFEALGIPIHTSAARPGPLPPSCLAELLAMSASAPSGWSPAGWHAFIALGARLAGVLRVCAHVGNLPPVWTGGAFAKFKLLVQLGRPFTRRLLCCSAYICDATVRDFGVVPRSTGRVQRLRPAAVCSGETQGPWPHQPPRLGVVGRLDQNRDYSTDTCNCT